jgi:bifunctional UDP-N-acetylglucosamine pyrophosphorylase/glucosamine-1-phosphate N-acetyltransferase/UDP-N-acetylglucosamine pyrophosphorylase
MHEPIAIILAAGKGTRMKSELPKVLVPVCGRPMVRFVLDAVRKAGIRRVLMVVGHRSDLVRQELADVPGIVFVEQTEQLGTGHAVAMCRQQLVDHNGPVLIVTGDSPLTQTSSLQKLLGEFEAQEPACLIGTTHKDAPQGLGRIIRDADGGFLAIIEEKDATPEERAVTEVNMSTYVFDSSDLLQSLEQLTTENVQGEYYITDCPGLLKMAGKQVLALSALEPCEALSINSLEELAFVETEMLKRVSR